MKEEVLGQNGTTEEPTEEPTEELTEAQPMAVLEEEAEEETGETVQKPTEDESWMDLEDLAYRYRAYTKGTTALLGEPPPEDIRPYTDSRFAAFEAEFRAYEPGDLTISKTVVGKGGNTTDDVFTFRITLDDPTINGDYKLADGSAVAFENGVATVRLKAGEKLTIKGLPANTPYTVTGVELENGYTPASVTLSGTILEKQEMHADFINVNPSGGVLITKDVVSWLDSEKDELFDFVVTLWQNGERFTGSYKYVDAQGAHEGDYYMLTFQLKHGDSVYLYDLPEDVEVTVTEVPYDSFDTAVDITADGTLKSHKETSSAKVTTEKVDEDEPDLVTFRIGFTNSRRTGVLSVTKAIEGDAETEANDKEYTFIITGPSYTAGNTYETDKGTVTFDEERQARVTVTGAGTVTIKGLPTGEYVVAEDKDGVEIEGYTLVTAGEGSAEVTDGEEAEITITNTYTMRLTSLTVEKDWDDNDSADRPDSVTVQLYKDGAAHGSPVTLSDANDWRYTWDELEEIYNWTVRETNVPDGYTPEIKKDGTNWTITNVLNVQPEPETSTPTSTSAPASTSSTTTTSASATPKPTTSTSASSTPKPTTTTSTSATPKPTTTTSTSATPKPTTTTSTSTTSKPTTTTTSATATTTTSSVTTTTNSATSTTTTTSVTTTTTEPATTTETEASQETETTTETETTAATETSSETGTTTTSGSGHMIAGSEESSPETDDNSYPGVWLALLLAAVGGMLVVSRKKYGQQ